VTASDATIGGYAHESGRSVIILVNKWDAVTTNRTDGKPPADREIFETQVRSALKYLSYAPIIFLSALEKTGLGRVMNEVKAVAAERRKRVTTGQMNRFLDKIDFKGSGADGQARADLLHDAGRGGAADVCAVYGSRRQAAFCVCAVFGEPDSGGVRI